MGIHAHDHQPVLPTDKWGGRKGGPGSQKDPVSEGPLFGSPRPPVKTDNITGVSPAELAMGRRLRSTLPTLSSNLNPPLHDRAAVSTAGAMKKAANKHYFHERHRARSLPELQPGDTVLQNLDH